MNKPFQLDVFLAEQEANGTPPTFKIGKTTYTLPAVMPLKVSVYLTRGDLNSAMEAVFGDNTEDVLDAGITWAAFVALIEQSYGLKMGESKASAI